MMVTDNSNYWPPVYTVKSHARAKCIKLKISTKFGLELIVPTRFNIKRIPAILLQNKAWIEKQLLKRLELTKPEDIKLPETLNLRAINQLWKVDYIGSPSRPKIIERPHQNEIVLIGSMEEQLLLKKLLINWVRKKAKQYLHHHLNVLSEKFKLSYNKITIRDQQTRWGSCTKEKNISLNYKILFLPESLATHILIHELCHTIHLNHSVRFWKLVEKLDPDCQKNRAAIKDRMEFIPSWTI